MGTDLEIKTQPEHSPDRSEAPMDVAVSSDVGSIPHHSEAKVMQCMNNYEDNDFDMENVFEGQALQANDSSEVDITDCGNSLSTGRLEDYFQDEAECSSSFGDTVSGMEINLEVTDGEVESKYVGGGVSGSFSNGCGDVFALRKKKLTDDWRVFIQPLRWRCKWLELQMKELNAQATKYDNALAKYEHKHRGLESLTSGDSDSKSAAYLAQLKRERVMKRRKRKRIEETMDLTSYMSHHNLFSFYDKKPLTDFGHVEDCSRNPGIEESLDFGNVPSSLEQVLAKIEMAHLNIRKVKARIEKVIGENPMKFVSLNSLSTEPRDQPTSAFRNDTAPPPDSILQSSTPRAGSQKVTGSSQGDHLVPGAVVADLKDRATSPDSTKSPNQKTVEAGNEMEIHHPVESQVANGKPVDVDRSMTVSLEKSREHLQIHKAAASVSVVGMDSAAGGPSHLEGSNKRSTSTTRTYVSKRRRRGRRTARPRRRGQK